MAVAMVASAADNADPKPMQFKAGEFNLDLYGTANIRNESRWPAS
jgi:hypothetical protein